MKHDKDLDNIYNEFQNYLDKTGKTFGNDKEFEKVFDDFLHETNPAVMEPNVHFMSEPLDEHDCLERAWNAETAEEALMFAKKALKFNASNLDAQHFIEKITAESDDDLQKKFEQLIKEEEKRLADEGYFDGESVGMFWDIWETRPYIRLRAAYAEHLIYMGKRKKAILEYEDIIRLSENDSLGIRFKLMHLYAFYEDELSALKLCKKYDGERQTAMLLPLAVLYYRLDDYTQAEKYLLKLFELDPGVKDIFAGEFDDADDAYLYSTTEGFLLWACETINKFMPL